YINRAVDYSNTGDDGDAIQDLLQALQFDSTSPLGAYTYYALGVILQQEGQYEAALYAYNRALSIDPSRTDARLNRAQIYESLGGFDENQIMSYPSIQLLITPVAK